MMDKTILECNAANLLCAICLTFFLLLFTGCSKDTPLEGTLLLAERLMSERPDSALCILNGIRPSPSASRGQTAHYALLLTQARNKNYIDETNDSLINIAVSYYKRHGKRLDFAKALFYQGAIRYYAHDYGRAIISAMQSNEWAKELNDDYWMAKSHELIADIYDDAYYFKEVIIHKEKAALHYAKAGATANHWYSLLDVAIAYSNLYDYAKSKSMLDSIQSAYLSQTQSVDSNFIANCLMASIPVLLYSEEYAEADKQFEELKKYGKYHTLDARDYAYAAGINLELGRKERADALIDSASTLITSDIEEICVNNEWIKLLKQKNDYKQAQAITDSLLRQQDRVISRLLQQSVAFAQRDYYNSQATRATFRAHQMKIILTIVLTASVAVLVLSIAFYKLKMRMKRTEIDRHVEEIQALAEAVRNQEKEKQLLASELSRQKDHVSQLSSALSSQQNRSSALKQLVDGLFKEKFRTMNMLCNEYFENSDSDKMRLLLFKEIEKEILKVSHPDKLQEIETVVNNCMDNIVTRLRTQLPQLKPEDIVFLTLIYAGFVPRAICIFTGIKLKTFYTKRVRLKERIHNSEAADREWFIEKMG